MRDPHRANPLLTIVDTVSAELHGNMIAKNASTPKKIYGKKSTNIV